MVEIALASAAVDLDGRNWRAAETDLDRSGWSVLPAVLTGADCDALIDLYGADRFRSHVVMARHGYGQGEYRYFAYPLPEMVQALRAGLYRRLVPMANLWQERLGLTPRFPEDHAAFLDRCWREGQRRPTPLLLQYGPGDYNRLHQDLYGDQVFPLQVAILLGEPDRDFTGGEFILTEQRSRMQSQATVVPLRRGDAVVFAVNARPVGASRGVVKVTMRHGVSIVRSGHRHTLGIIFHDAA